MYQTNEFAYTFNLNILKINKIKLKFNNINLWVKRLRRERLDQLRNTSLDQRL